MSTQDDEIAQPEDQDAQQDEVAGGEDVAGDEIVEEGVEAGDEVGDELTITLEGDEKPPEEEEPGTLPSWVRDLRVENRKKEKRIRDLERRLSEKTPAEVEVFAGPEPTFESCNYDAAEYKKKLLEWQEKDLSVKAKQAEKQKAAEAQQASWQKRIVDVDSATKALRISGADEAKEAFESGLSELQQALIMSGPEDAKQSAMLRHVIGANPAIAKKLAAIQDPVKFAWAAAKLEDKMKQTRKTAAPVPERRLSSGAVGTAAVDSAIEAARKRAEKTGDRSEVAKLIRQRSQRLG